ncbi:alpha/beta fold hydrolase [Maribellus mangrovi]|uniref:alpha/beta fold hydrolase n=1 Tax=Maribellus mangrovi TaxID=3133146 RepID=UPI0030EEAEB2
MSTILKYFGLILKWIFIIVLLLFAIATLLGKSYLQTLLLLLIVFAFFWWPAAIAKKWNKTKALVIRIAFIIILLLINFIAFKPDPKTSIYTSESGKGELYRIYDELQTKWPDDTEDIYINIEYGKVHVLACGEKTNPPIVLLHAASMGAHSWAENLPPLLPHFRIYSIDNVGEGNKSELADATRYPENEKEIADLYVHILDELGVESAAVLGASNGGFIAQCLTYFYPQKVEKLALFGPMGITQLSGASYFMLSLATMYPFGFIRDWVENWAFGADQNVHQKYGEWFSCILTSTIPSVAQPVPMTNVQKQNMDLPVLLFLGTNDPIVGNADRAKELAGDYPNIQIEILESGHLIAVEHANTINNVLADFLLGFEN